jgi:hypothetical protein
MTNPKTSTKPKKGFLICYPCASAKPETTKKIGN